MDSPSTQNFTSDFPLHPGEFVLEYLESYSWTQRDLARRSGLTPKTISEICSQKAPITPATAVAFENVLGRPAHFWLALQRRFDEAKARERVREESKSWSAWAKQFPIAEMRKYPWFGLGKTEDPTESLLRFFGVSTPEGWKSVWNSYAVAYRQTRKFSTSQEAIASWVRATELAAEMIETADFDADRLKGLLPELRHLTRLRVEEGLTRMQELCASVGTALVLVPELPHTGISGCARMLSDRKAMVALSLRYKKDDQLWFTFFHELGHLLLHRKTSTFILDNATETLTDNVIDPGMQKKEEEANRFACDALISPDGLAEFIRAGTFTSESIHDFAEKEDVGPGIVVGRLQHDGLLKFHQGNALKQTLHWDIASLN